MLTESRPVIGHVRMTAWALRVAALLGMSIGCGSGLAPDARDPTVVPLTRWPAEYAAVVCAKIAGCCDAVERMRSLYENDNQCRAMQADIRSGLVNLVLEERIAYDEKAARRCLDELAGTPCAAFFNAPADDLWPSCNQMTHGARKIGEPCDGQDMFCESSNCVLETQTCGPLGGCPISCAAGEFCDAAAQLCRPVRGDGASCLDDLECASPSFCRVECAASTFCDPASSRCGGPLTDGTICEQDAECVAGTCVGRVCGPRRPNGAACALDTDCSSGACFGPNVDARTCGPPQPDGATCTTNSACASGTCAQRTALGARTCGTLFCDGV